MNIFKRKATKTVALALAAVLQVYVSGGFALAAPAAPKAAAPVWQDAQGRLSTTNDNPVTVNGNSAKTGDTVFSGQRVQTPAGTGATVDVPGTGSVQIDPGADVTVTFSGGSISVVVTRGCVRLTANNGVTGTLQAGGNSKTTGPNGGNIDICDTAAGAVPVGTAGGAGSAGTASGSATAGGLGTAASVALTAGIVGAFALIAHELISDSGVPGAPCVPSPGNPTLNQPAVTCNQ